MESVRKCLLQISFCLFFFQYVIEKTVMYMYIIVCYQSIIMHILDIILTFTLKVYLSTLRSRCTMGGFWPCMCFTAWHVCHRILHTMLGGRALVLSLSTSTRLPPVQSSVRMRYSCMPWGVLCLSMNAAERYSMMCAWPESFFCEVSWSRKEGCCATESF